MLLRLVLIIPLLSACGGSGTNKGGGSADGGTTDGADITATTGGEDVASEVVEPADEGPPPGTCAPGQRWEKGVKVFKEATTAWNLDGVEGIRFSVTDLVHPRRREVRQWDVTTAS